MILLATPTFQRESNNRGERNDLPNRQNRTECSFMTKKGCGYAGGQCKAIVEKCEGCSRIFEWGTQILPDICRSPRPVDPGHLPLRHPRQDRIQGNGPENQPLESLQAGRTGQEEIDAKRPGIVKKCPAFFSTTLAGYSGQQPPYLFESFLELHQSLPLPSTGIGPQAPSPGQFPLGAPDSETFRVEEFLDGQQLLQIFSPVQAMVG